MPASPRQPPARTPLARPVPRVKRGGRSVDEADTGAPLGGATPHGSPPGGAHAPADPGSAPPVHGHDDPLPDDGFPGLQAPDDRAPDRASDAGDPARDDAGVPAPGDDPASDPAWLLGASPAEHLQAEAPAAPVAPPAAEVDRLAAPDAAPPASGYAVPFGFDPSRGGTSDPWADGQGATVPAPPVAPTTGAVLPSPEGRAIGADGYEGPELTIDALGITARRRPGLVERVTWEGLSEVSIRAVAEGGFSTSHWWLLGDDDGTGVVVPHAGVPSDVLLHRLRRLPGFDLTMVLTGLDAVGDCLTLVWRRGSP